LNAMKNNTCSRKFLRYIVPLLLISPLCHSFLLRTPSTSSWGYLELALIVDNDNISAQKLYTKMGFEVWIFVFIRVALIYLLRIYILEVFFSFIYLILIPYGCV